LQLPESVTSNLQQTSVLRGKDLIDMYAFSKSVRKADHVRRYTIHATSSGWEVRTEQDSEAVRRACYHDWHRVEIARRVMVLELASLERNGWREET
jgi:hypothetical protein